LKVHVSDAEDLRATLETQTTEELVTILRNRDADEWRPEVFDIVATILAGRGISPASVSAMGPEGSDVVEERPLATVARYFSPTEAHATRLALEAAGLEAWVVDETLGTAYGVGVGTRVQVRLQDQEAAQAVLEGEPRGFEELPPDVAPPPCPTCGSRDVRLFSELVQDTDAERAFGGRRRRDWYYDCQACNHRWRDETSE
jgi:hypothetical protein